jgi:hypothetical protein
MSFEMPEVADFTQPYQPLNLVSHLERIAADPEQRKLYLNRQIKLPHTALTLLTPEHSLHIINDMANYEIQSGLFDIDNLYTVLLNGGSQFSVRYASRIAENAVELCGGTDEELSNFQIYPNLAYINASRYGRSQNGGEKLKFKQRFPRALRTAGVNVMLCDDVVDEAITVQLLAHYLDGNRRRGLFNLRREGPANSVGVRAFTSKGIGDLSQFDPRNVVIGSTGPNVWFAEMGMDGEFVIKDAAGNVKKVLKEVKRHNEGLSVPSTQDVKYKDEMEELMALAADLDLTTLNMNDITFIDTSKPRQTVAKFYYGRFIDLVKAA